MLQPATKPTLIKGQRLAVERTSAFVVRLAAKVVLGKESVGFVRILYRTRERGTQFAGHFNASASLMLRVGMKSTDRKKNLPKSATVAS